MDWLTAIAIASLVVAAGCALVIALDLAAHPQHMWIMNVVRPLTALYAGPFALWSYYRVGRLSSRESVKQARQRGEKMPGKKKPFWQSSAIGATHCGSGCAWTISAPSGSSSLFPSHFSDERFLPHG